MADVETTQVEEIPTNDLSEHDEASHSTENVQPDDHEEAHHDEHTEEQQHTEEHHDTEPLHTEQGEEHTEQPHLDEEQAVQTPPSQTETEATTVVTDEHVEPPQQKEEEPPRTQEPVSTNDEPNEEYKPKPRARLQIQRYDHEPAVSTPIQKSSADYQREIDSLTRRVAELSSALSIKEDSVKFFSTDLNKKEEELSAVNNKLAEAQRKALDLDSQVIILQRKLKKHPEGTADDAAQQDQTPKPSSSDNFQYNISLDGEEKLNLEINAYATHTKLQSRNEQLHEDLKHAAEDLARAETDRKELEVKCQQLEQEKLQFQEKIANDELQIKDLKGKNDDLTNALENEKNQRKIMEVRAAEAQQNLSEIQEKAAKVEHLSSDLENAVRKNDELEAKLEESHAANSTLQQQVEKLTADVTALKGIVAHSQDKTRARHELQVSIVQNEVQQEKERADNAQKEIERLKAALKDAQAASQTSQQSSISSGRNVKTLERKAKAASLQIDDLRAQVETQNLEISRLNEKIKETKLTCSKLSVEKSDWESKAKYLEQELTLTKGRASLVPPTVYPAPAKTLEKPGEESE